MKPSWTPSSPRCIRRTGSVRLQFPGTAGGFSPRSNMSYISHRGVDIWGIQYFRFWNAFPVYNFSFNIVCMCVCVCVSGGERGPYFASPGMNDNTLLVRDSTGLQGYMHMLHCQLYSSFARVSCGLIAMKEGLDHTNKESRFIQHEENRKDRHHETRLSKFN